MGPRLHTSVSLYRNPASIRWHLGYWVPHPFAFFAKGWDTTNPIRVPTREAHASLRRLVLLHILHIPQQRPPMIEPVTIRVVIARPQHGVVVLMHVPLLFPLLQEQRIRFLRELLPHLRIVIIPQPQLHQLIHRPPDAPPPIVLIVERRIIERNRRNHPLPPELLRIDR